MYSIFELCFFFRWFWKVQRIFFRTGRFSRSLFVRVYLITARFQLLLLPTSQFWMVGRIKFSLFFGSVFYFLKEFLGITWNRIAGNFKYIQYVILFFIHSWRVWSIEQWLQKINVQFFTLTKNVCFFSKQWRLCTVSHSAVQKYWNLQCS